MKVATAEQIRAIDRAAVELGLPSVVLMENAGLAVMHAVVEIAEALGDDPSVLVVAGKGNNGGDGLVVARHLSNHGYDVAVALLCTGEELKGDAAVNYAAARGYGVELLEDCQGQELMRAIAGADLLVDAILGTGVSGDVTGRAREALDLINDRQAPVVAVDLPSGINADTGAVCGAAVRALVTVTFGLPKVGNVVYPGAAYGGELRVADISLPPAALEDAAIQTSLLTPQVAESALPPRWPDMHKGDAGRVLVVAGSRGYTGAATLAAMGALRAGAGLVYLAAPASLNMILETKCTEAITLPQPETDVASLARAAADELVAVASQCNAVVLGPGLSRHPETAELVGELVRRVEVPLVIDADGLNCLADVGPLVLGERPGPTVITPHPGELGRLLGDSVAEVQVDRLARARRAAAALDVLTVLKGAGTIVARPDGEAWINTTGSSALATGGTGDVLAGMQGAFVAGGSTPEEASLAAVYYHGLAGDLAAKHTNERHVIASDLLAALGEALPRG